MKTLLSQGQRFLRMSPAAVSLLLVSAHFAWAEVTSPDAQATVESDRQDQLRLTSKDNNLEIEFGGRAFLDWNVISANSQFDDSVPSLQGHGTEIRSARLHSEGTIYQILRYRLEYEFEGRHPTPQDVWIELAVIQRVGQIRLGHMKEPFSLVALTDGSDITFMERALPAEAFAPGRNMGVQLSNSALDDRMTWKVGAYQATDSFGKGFADGANYNLTARVTGLPWYADNGRKLFHFGLSYSHQFRSRASPVRFQSRPEAHLTSEKTVDTGDFDADDVDLLTPEIVLVYGPISLQAEYFYVPVSRNRVKDLSYDGFYITLSYFVINGNRPYDMREGYFGRVIPDKNFHPTKPGCGALELAGRISELDTNGPSLRGGKELNFTFGVNWYLNPNTRFMFNYIRASAADRPDGAEGDLHIAQARIQIDL